MKVSSTIQALRERCPSFKERVFGVAEYQNLSNVINSETLPAAYVFTISENPQTLQRLENSYYQVIDASVAVVLVVSSSDMRGQSAADVAEDLKEEVFKAILGWAPLGDKNCTYEYSNYQILDSSMCPAALFIQLEFNCSYAINVEDTRIPEQLNNETTELHTIDVGVDLIGKDNKPDGQIDLKFKVKDLW